jgi:hypothetical protein
MRNAASDCGLSALDEQPQRAESDALAPSGAQAAKRYGSSVAIHATGVVVVVDATFVR